MPIFGTLNDLYGPTAPNYSGAGNGGAATPTSGGAVMDSSPTTASAGGSVGQITIIPGLDGTLFGYPVTWLISVGAIACLVYYFIHKHVGGVEKELATPRIGLGSFFSIGVQAVVFIALFKAVLTKYRIPGLTELVGSV